MISFSTEYLIIHENDVDWEKLSSDKDDMFSLIEIRLFRSKINWKSYIMSHLRSCPFTTQMMEVASKYFDDAIYTILASFNVADEDFILNHKEKFNFELLIKNSNLSEKFLLETMENWVHLENIEEIFKSSKYINLEDPKYNQIKLIFEVD